MQFLKLQQQRLTDMNTELLAHLYTMLYLTPENEEDY